MPSNFTVRHDAVDLPTGATAQSRRLKAAWRGRPVAAFSQSAYRPYVYPVLTPAGVPVTGETPIDHPHHNSITVGADHFDCRFQYAADRLEDGTYNFYVNDVFQGRAPGRTVAVSTDSREVSQRHLRVVQTVHWQGPAEWGAPDRRTVAVETRTIDVYPRRAANVFDVRSQLSPTEWDVSIGPTRHAYFTVRLADGIRIDDGADVLDSKGRRRSDEITGQTADWVDVSGPAPYGHRAGVAVAPHPSAAGHPWAVYDWGSIVVNPFLDDRYDLKVGSTLDVSIRVIAHDGGPDEAGVAEIAAELLP